jgi:ATP-dependent DNA helicase RecQ
MLYNKSDDAKLSKRIEDTFPPRDEIRQVYEHLAFYYQIATGDGFGVKREFSIEEFCHRFHHFPVRVHSALQILSRAGYIDYDESPDLQTRVRFRLERHELYRLNDSTPDEERVIVALLRCYGGLFADFGYIDEALVAQQAGLLPMRLHEVLKTLSQKHILEYIPRQQVPTIQYLQRREDATNVQLPSSVYEQRLQQYRERIHAVLRYVQSQDTCRSRQLLTYFGETDAHDCGQCDVCQDQVPEDQQQQGRREIYNLLKDGKHHHVTELHKLKLPMETIDAALASMLSEEEIKMDDSFLFLA